MAEFEEGDRVVDYVGIAPSTQHTEMQHEMLDSIDSESFAFF